MSRFLHKKISLTAALAVALGAALAGAGATWAFTNRQAQKTPEELFEAAVRDAVFAQEDEIYPLISLEQGAPYAVYDSRGRVLLFTFHKHPEAYPCGRQVFTQWGEVWAFTGGELAHWYKANGALVEDWPQRLRQLMGLSPDNRATHFTAMWVNPQNVLRPAYVQDIGQVFMKTSFPKDVPEDFRAWFNGNIIKSYFEGADPWTRLGYTYDWAQGSGEYGLSEFLVAQGSTVEVAYTCTTEEMIKKLADGSWLPLVQ